jgi:hypothetical protein
MSHLFTSLYLFAIADWGKCDSQAAHIGQKTRHFPVLRCLLMKLSLILLLFNSTNGNEDED